MDEFPEVSAVLYDEVAARKKRSEVTKMNLVRNTQIEIAKKAKIVAKQNTRRSTTLSLRPGREITTGKSNSRLSLVGESEDIDEGEDDEGDT